jgi:putative glutamine amidotransferase
MMESVETVGGPDVKDRRPKKRLDLGLGPVPPAPERLSGAAHAASRRVRAKGFSWEKVPIPFSHARVFAGTISKIHFNRAHDVPKETAVKDSKPLIGINADYRGARKDTPAFTYLSAGYYDALTKIGAIPVIIPPLTDANDLSRILDLLDGVILTGATGDLDPRRDGFMLHGSVRLLESRREDFDRMLMSLAARRRMPVYGIGMGMQLLNVSQGGNLFLHIPEDLPKAIPHQDSMDPNHRHALVAEPGSLMERVYGEGEIRVNSMHHMAIDEVAPGFTVTARCPDGVIEAIESVMDDWFAFGTQFHPEAPSASALDLRIFEEFLAGITGEAVELAMADAA